MRRLRTVQELGERERERYLRPLPKKSNELEGERSNFVQIGPGTNSTFIQNCAGEWHEWDENIEWLLSACSKHRQHEVRGIAVEPVSELIPALRLLSKGIVMGL